MRIHLPAFLLSVLLFVSSGAGANEPIGGLLRMYSDQLQGRVTASGELYDVSGLTASHASLPLGTMLRVANFETGRMVDVRINDRKRKDDTLLHLSRAAAEHIGLPTGRAAQGSMMVIGTMPPLPATTKVAAPNLTLQNNADSPAKKRFAPFQSLKRDPLLDAVNEPEKAALLAQSDKSASTPKRGLFGKKKQVQYGIPAGQYEPLTMAHNSDNRVIPGQGEVVPLSANSATVAKRSSAPAGRAAVPTGYPYRVQFGAFRRGPNAAEFNSELLRSGLKTTVLKSSANGLFLVVTSGGFTSAEEAQQWIHREGTRRGWRDRPVVIR